MALISQEYFCSLGVTILKKLLVALTFSNCKHERQFWKVKESPILGLISLQSEISIYRTGSISDVHEFSWSSRRGCQTGSWQALEAPISLFLLVSFYCKVQIFLIFSHVYQPTHFTPKVSVSFSAQKCHLCDLLRNSHFAKDFLLYPLLRTSPHVCSAQKNAPRSLSLEGNLLLLFKIPSLGTTLWSRIRLHILHTGVWV